MLYAYQVYETLLDLSRKDLRGLSLTPEEYNNTARLVNEIVFAKYYSEFESTQDNSEALSAFKVLNESIPIAGGIGSLPAWYYHMVGMPRYTDISGVSRYLDMVSSFEHSKREQDYLTKATLTHPTFRFGIASTTSDMTIYVTPSVGINPIYIDYIRTPDVPFLDYYVSDTTLNYTWLTTGVITAVPLGYTARNGTVGPNNVISQTIDYEWNDEDMPLILNLFLQYLGIQLPSPELYEGGTLQEQKSDKQ